MAKSDSRHDVASEFPESDYRHPKWQGHTHAWRPKKPKVGQTITCTECGMSMAYDPRAFE